jgi:glycerol kinase
VPHPHILAHDLGTTGNKASLFDAEGGTVVASAFEAYETAYPRPNWAEQDRVDFLDRHQRQGHVLSRHPSACALAHKRPSETIDIYEQVPYNFVQMAIQWFYH